MSNQAPSTGIDDSASEKAGNANQYLTGTGDKDKLADKQKNDPLVGKTIANRYEILELIGSGGFGSVYKAKHLNLKKTIALKILRAEYVEDKKIASRFQHEAMIASNISNPHVASAFDHGICDQTKVVFIAMEYVAGPSLKDLIKAQGKVDVERALNIAIQLCDGIGAAHAKSVIHRDIKPSNIILTDYENADFVKITDFGIAKVLNESEELKKLTKTETESFLGTCQYMGPEQFQSGYKGDYRSDIYSIGCVLFEMLTGKPPFSGDNFAATIHMHTNEKIPDLVLDADPVIVHRLNSIIQKALCKEPSMRYQEMKNLMWQLKGVHNRLTKLRLSKSNRLFLWFEQCWLLFLNLLRIFSRHLFDRSDAYSKLLTVFVVTVVVLIGVFSVSTILGVFGNRDLQYQPVLHKLPEVMPSKQLGVFILDPKDKISFVIDDADTLRRSGDLRAAFTKYDQAEVKINKMGNAHLEMARVWFGRMMCNLFADRPELVVLCAPYCYAEYAKCSEECSKILLGTAHAVAGEAYFKIGKHKESENEFKVFVDLLENLIQRNALQTSDELAYACGFAGQYFEKNGNLQLAESLLERAADHWQAAGTEGRYNLTVSYVNLALVKIKLNQYKEASDLIEKALNDLRQSGDFHWVLQNKLRFYAINLRLKTLFPIVPILF